MGERLHRSSEVANFANSPDPEHLLPQHNRTALEERASQVGSAVGKVVVMLRRTQDRLKDVANTGGDAATRSEEHTSELQSRQYLVCRLLLEKKKDTEKIANSYTTPCNRNTL